MNKTTSEIRILFELRASANRVLKPFRKKFDMNIDFETLKKRIVSDAIYDLNNTTDRSGVSFVYSDIPELDLVRNLNSKNEIVFINKRDLAQYNDILTQWLLGFAFEEGFDVISRFYFEPQEYGLRSYLYFEYKI